MPSSSHTENTLLGAIVALSLTERLVAPSGFTLSHVAVLRLLGEREGLGNRAIGEVLGLTAPTVSRLLERLTALGLVRASLDPSDLRRNLFRLEVQAHAILFELRKSLAPHGLDEALALHGALGRVARRAGLAPTACRVVAAASARPATVKQLGRAAALRQSTVSTALASLQRVALVRSVQTAGECDGRQRCYALTEQGKRLQSEILTCCNSIVDENSFVN